MRAREHGIAIGDGTPGPVNAITDVPGLRIGHRTLIEGSGPLARGRGPVRTGVTVVLAPGDVWRKPVFAGAHRLNGNGEMTGLEWVRECGMLTSPIGLTNTHSVGIVRDALIAEMIAGRAEHAREAIAAAAGGVVPEGAVGSGTGMICHGFKGGIGTASRVRPAAEGGHTVGVLVQANHGRRERLAVNGIPVGCRLDDVPRPPATAAAGPGAGSIIVIVATDAPLLPHQCTRLAQRAGLGVGRTGGVGEHSSGDLFLCFATGNRGMSPGTIGQRVPLNVPVVMFSDAYITGLYDATVEATEEAIVNAMLAARTLEGPDGVLAHGLDGERLRAAMDIR